jgi:hypothetical protein
MDFPSAAARGTRKIEFFRCRGARSACSTRGTAGFRFLGRHDGRERSATAGAPPRQERGFEEALRGSACETACFTPFSGGRTPLSILM